MASVSHESLSVDQVTGKSDIDAFIAVPWALYSDDPNWIPPLRFERKEFLNPSKNPYFEHAKAAFWLARRGGQVVGRISAQIDELAQTHHGPGTGHFGLIEAPDDPEVFSALFHAAESWLTDNGMTRALGPFNLSVNEECGLLIDGFDEPPRVMMGHAKPYYGTRIEALGYAKEKDLWAYDLSVASEFPKNVQKILRRAEAIKTLKLRRLNTKQLDEDLHTIIDIFNDAWCDNWGFIPMTENEIKKTGRDLKPFLIEDICYIAEYDGEPAAFMLTLPDVNEAIADLNGSLLPFGWAKLLWRLKVRSPAKVRVPLMGVRKKYQGTLAGASMALLLIDTIRQNARKRKFKHGELSWILDDNLPMQKILEMILCRHYKTYRIYAKALEPFRIR